MEEQAPLQAEGWWQPRCRCARWARMTGLVMQLGMQQALAWARTTATIAEVTPCTLAAASSGTLLAARRSRAAMKVASWERKGSEKAA